MGLYSILRNVYHTIVPQSVRRMRGLEFLTSRMKTRFGSHDEVYNQEYFAGNIEGPAAQVAPILAELVTNEFRPKRVIDVGCGTGAILEALSKLGCTCVGLEYADAGLQMCKARNLDARKFDLEKDVWASEGGSFDVVVSTEVAEHLPERIADRYVDQLVSLGPRIVFTAATPGQGGADHVNEQPHEYWIAKFEARGLRYQADMAARWRTELKARQAAPWYSGNLMIFDKPSNGA
jgi:SAM-dependent methyltransferase